MAQFPRNEHEVKVLAQSTVAMLTVNAMFYAMPPMTAIALQAILNSFFTLGDEAVTGPSRRQTGHRHQRRRSRRAYRRSEGNSLLCRAHGRSRRRPVDPPGGRRADLPPPRPPTGDWKIASPFLESEASLNNEERRNDCEYRVSSVGKACRVPPSLPLFEKQEAMS